MKKVFFFIFVLLNSNVNAQIVFDNVVGTSMGYNDFGDAVIQTLDSGYIIVGSTSGFIISPFNGLYIIKLKNSGDTAWTKVYDFSQQGGQNADGHSIIQLKDSNYIICGVVGDSIEKAGDAFLLKLNSSGEIIWYQQIEGGFNDRAYDLKQTIDGGFIIVGDNYDSTVISKISLIKTDNTGNKQWQQFYGVNNINYSHSVFTSNDSGFIIGGETLDTICWCYKIYIIKTDSAGNLQWEKQYGHPLGQKWGYAVPTQDGGYIISGRKKYLDTLYYGYVIKTDDTGKVVWEKEYGEDSYFKGFKRIIQLDDGSYLAAGDNQHYDSVIVRNSNAWLVKLDSVGNGLWSKTYTHYGGDTTQDYLEDISLTNDGGFIFCGYVIGSTSMSNDVWLVKTDCEGNEVKWDSVNCQLNVGIKEHHVSGIKYEVEVYPNPFSEQTTIRIANIEQGIMNYELSIYDVLGREVKNDKLQAPAYELKRGDLQSGIYFYQIRNKHEIIAVGKLAVQ